MSYSTKKWYKPTKLSTKIICAVILLFFIRIMANIPVPFINREYLSTLFADASAFTLLNTFSGGSFTNMTFMALGVTPYISASIILQLLCITFPRMKEIQKEGSYGQKKWKIITILTGVALGVIQAIAMALTLGRRGLFTNYNFTSVFVVSILWVIGGTVTILIGEYISKFCIGNGISLILASNIIAELPGDIITFWNVYLREKNTLEIVSAAIVFIFIVLLLISFTCILTGAQKEIPVIYPKSANSSYKNTSSIPIKLNAAGVMPIIFTSTIFSIPLMFIQANTTNKVASAIYGICNTHYRYTTLFGVVGLVLEFIMVIAFAYFYTAITFNTTEIANRLRKKGACIPGIRPGINTDIYLYNKSKYMTFIGAVLLFLLTQIPTVITNLSNIKSLSFGGTSVIIIVGVVMETTMAIKSEMMVNAYSRVSDKHFFGMKVKTTTGFLS